MILSYSHSVTYYIDCDNMLCDIVTCLLFLKDCLLSCVGLCLVLVCQVAMCVSHGFTPRNPKCKADVIEEIEDELIG